MKPVRCGCGGKAEAYEIHFWGKCYVCECTECGLTTKPKDTEAEAIEAWNTAMSGVALHPCTTPNGAYTSGCTTTNTTDPNKDFHPVRDFMVGAERTAKVMNDGINYCENCEGYVEAPMAYCPYCGAKLEWE